MVIKQLTGDEKKKDNQGTEKTPLFHAHIGLAEYTTSYLFHSKKK